jgi:hypothetical protein
MSMAVMIFCKFSCVSESLVRLFIAKSIKSSLSCVSIEGLLAFVLVKDRPGQDNLTVAILARDVVAE